MVFMFVDMRVSWLHDDNTVYNQNVFILSSVCFYLRKIELALPLTPSFMYKRLK